jgi:hypothetical protein
MLRALSSAGCAGRIREMPPLTTLLTYFVPSRMMTSPSLPARVDDDVALAVERDAVRPAERRALHEDRDLTGRRDLQRLPALWIGIVAAVAGLRGVDRPVACDAMSFSQVELRVIRGGAVVKIGKKKKPVIR